RAALDQNNAVGGGRIEFALDVPGVQTIRPAAELPAVNQPVFLDGWSEGGVGYTGPPLIELDGGGIDPTVGANGLTIQSVGVVVRGLAVNNFPSAAVQGIPNGGYGILARTFGVGTPAVWLYGDYV